MSVSWRRTERATRQRENPYIVESTRVLRDDVQIAAQRTERSPVYAVTMGSTQDIWPGRMDCAVDHKCRCIEQPTPSRRLSPSLRDRPVSDRSV